MTIKKITPRGWGLEFFADTDELIRYPNDAGFEVVAVMRDKVTESRLPVPVLLQADDGEWHFSKPLRNAGVSLQALVRLAKGWMPRQALGTAAIGSGPVRVFEFQKQTLDWERWVIATQWDDWDARKLLMKEREGKLRAFGIQEMPITTFQTICYRELNLRRAIRR